MVASCALKGSNSASGGTNGTSAADGAGGSDSGGGMSWLEAIAASMGEAAGKKAAKMVELSNKLNSMKPAAEGDTAGQQQQALEMNKINSQFQAVSQEFNMLQTAFSNAIKSIGEGLVKMAGKQ